MVVINKRKRRGKETLANSNNGCSSWLGFWRQIWRFMLITDVRIWRNLQFSMQTGPPLIVLSPKKNPPGCKRFMDDKNQHTFYLCARMFVLGGASVRP